MTAAGTFAKQMNKGLGKTEICFKMAGTGMCLSKGGK